MKMKAKLVRALLRYNSGQSLVLLLLLLFAKILLIKARSII